MKTQILHNLQAADYEHPFDKTALDMVRDVPLLSEVMNVIMNWTVVKWELTKYQGSYFQVTEDSCPSLYNQIQNVANTLELEQMPSIYTIWSYLINAFTMGDKQTVMLSLNTGTIDLLSEEELAFIVGHEMGHIKSRHFIYHQILWFLSDLVPKFPGVDLVLKLPLLKWYRMSELTADRAGLLACQDINVALSALTKMGGIPKKYFNEVNNDAIMNQAREFEKEAENLLNDIIKKGFKTLSILESTHPWTVLRAAELLRWYESGEYQQVLDAHAEKICPKCKRSVPQEVEVCPICGYRFS